LLAWNKYKKEEGRSFHDGVSNETTKENGPGNVVVSHKTTKTNWYLKVYILDRVLSVCVCVLSAYVSTSCRCPCSSPSSTHGTASCTEAGHEQEPKKTKRAQDDSAIEKENSTNHAMPSPFMRIMRSAGVRLVRYIAIFNPLPELYPASLNQSLPFLWISAAVYAE
jgi:hypothetical protein